MPSVALEALVLRGRNGDIYRLLDITCQFPCVVLKDVLIFGLAQLAFLIAVRASYLKLLFVEAKLHGSPPHA